MKTASGQAGQRFITAFPDNARLQAITPAAHGHTAAAFLLRQRTASAGLLEGWNINGSGLFPGLNLATLERCDDTVSL